MFMAAPSQAAAAGPQTETARFACWEEHTRGVGSKLMAAMGYREGQGLGPANSGAVAPIEVWLLTLGASLSSWVTALMLVLLSFPAIFSHVPRMK